jgi:NDP-sugar pyrophosphorylase family protein
MGEAVKRAVVLAGGLGTRLRPYTIAIPKPLMPIGNLPILEIILRQLAHRGFERATLAVNYQAEILRAYFGDGARWNIQIDYSLEDKPLGTMGPLKLIKDLPENFLVMNGDVLTDLDFAAFAQCHVRENRLFTIAAARREQFIDYGVLQEGGDQQLSGFQEKPKVPYLVSMGVYCLNRRVADSIPAGEPFGFDHLVLKLLQARQPVKIATHGGYWLDIGRADDYQKAVDDWPSVGPAIMP